MSDLVEELRERAFEAGFPKAALYLRAAEEIKKLRDAVQQALAAMEALHPSAASDMTDEQYARLWNATTEMLGNV